MTRLPIGVTMEFAADPNAIRAILSNPREIETEGFKLLDSNAERACLEVMSHPERYLFRLHGRPVMVLYMQHAPGLIEYSIYATSDVTRYPFAMVRCSRAFLDRAQQDYPKVRHVVACVRESNQEDWLRLLGFERVETETSHPVPGLIVLERK